MQLGTVQKENNLENRYIADISDKEEGRITESWSQEKGNWREEIKFELVIVFVVHLHPFLVNYLQ